MKLGTKMFVIIIYVFVCVLLRNVRLDLMFVGFDVCLEQDV